MVREKLFSDRAEGGRQLAEALRAYRNSDCVVLALPRGGVVTGAEVARALNSPLDLVITRKLTPPQNPEYAIGAITDDGESVLNPQIAEMVSGEYLEAEKARRLAEALDRRHKYLGGRATVPLEGRIAILVDDGIATGYTMKAAIVSVRKRNPAKIVVATPVAPAGVASRFAEADEVIAPYTPDEFYAIGQFYQEFDPVDDREVVRLMAESQEAQT